MAATQVSYAGSINTTLPDGAYITGPYMYANRATNLPIKNYLLSLGIPRFHDLRIPKILLYCVRANNNIQNPNVAAEWRIYLCSAIVRHFSYRQFTSPIRRKTATPEYRSLEWQVIDKFMNALGPTASPLSYRQKEALVGLERDLTHETFGHFPELFERAFEANSQLRNQIDDATPNLDVFKRSSANPKALISHYLHLLQTKWIDLTDPADILSGDSDNYRTYMEQKNWRGAKILELNFWSASLDDSEDEDEIGDDDDNGNDIDNETPSTIRPTSPNLEEVRAAPPHYHDTTATPLTSLEYRRRHHRRTHEFHIYEDPMSLRERA